MGEQKKHVVLNISHSVRCHGTLAYLFPVLCLADVLVRHEDVGTPPGQAWTCANHKFSAAVFPAKAGIQGMGKGGVLLIMPLQAMGHLGFFMLKL